MKLMEMMLGNRRLETPTMKANRRAPMRNWMQRFGTLMLAMLLMPMAAHAGAPWESGADSVMEILQGPLVTTLSVIAVVALGLAAIFGKLEWKTAGSVIAGIVIIRGAPAIVAFFEAAAGA